MSEPKSTRARVRATIERMGGTPSTDIRVYRGRRVTKAMAARVQPKPDLVCECTEDRYPCRRCDKMHLHAAYDHGIQKVRQFCGCTSCVRGRERNG